MTYYIATVHKDTDSDYGVQFYDFPGCITAEETIEATQIIAQEALIGHINLMVADGDEIPVPSSLETILSDSDHQDAIVFLVIHIPDKTFNRINT
ncbi:type II toxin-antitoxin system HicB family antitoxin [Planktothrix agardhii]|uniref:type II toxin-antitoxin system HicB family antitoxin n=1 Tax=Planktothrix agardhii TaxID=1160 RepID=UPI001D0B9B90|nr:type II toxin-antitoxin system HicB family antitoxin [Planktothrix agardhii]MCB8758969.1 type II toxin-antitoxin system HicB family antitoxin [Planktothrix agardhii 1813]